MMGWFGCSGLVGRGLVGRGLMAFALAIACSPFARGQMEVVGSPAKTGAPVKVPQFDVVTIKPNKTGGGNVSVSIGDGSYKASNLPLKSLLGEAYDIKEDLISGLPGWASGARYDIQAKVVEPDKKLLDSLTHEQQSSMLLPILAERFHLKAHTEVKTLPVYELVVMKDGPKFKLTTAGPDDHDSGMMKVQNTHLTAHGVELDGLVNQLSYQLHRTVVDKTGLKGKFDLDLTWSKDDGSTAAVGTNGSDAETAPSIFTAVQEQLGLKLNSAKGPVTTLVVDSLEAPTED